jgi:hypothetical protein
MAVKPITKPYTMTGTAIALSTILGRADNTWMGSLALRAARSNSDDVFWQDDDGNPGGYIGPGEAVTMDFGEGQALIGGFSLKGDAGDVVYITVGINRHYFPGDA